MAWAKAFTESQVSIPLLLSILECREEMKEFDKIDERFDKIDERINKIDLQFDNIKGQFDETRDLFGTFIGVVSSSPVHRGWGSVRHEVLKTIRELNVYGWANLPLSSCALPSDLFRY